jgi:protocatechuate 3,4-dioxygenase beta subunit
MPNRAGVLTGCAFPFSLALALALSAAAGAAPRDDEATVTYVGRVLDPDGSPLERARVFPIESRGQGEIFIDETGWRGWRDVIERPLPEQDLGAHAAPGGETGKDGCFAVRGQADLEPLQALVYHPRYRPRRVRPRADVAAPDGTVDLGDVFLERGREIAVTVADEDGRPIASATVAVQPLVDDEAETTITEGFPGRCRIARTDAAGRAVIEGLEPIQYAVAALEGTRPAAEKRADLRDKERVSLSLRIRPGRVLHVLARDRKSGAPVAGARVTVERTSSKFADSPRFREIEATTDAPGEAAFDLDPEALFRVTIRPPGVAAPPGPWQGDPYALWETVRAGASLEFVLDSIVPFSVAVRDAETGSPLGGVRVRLSPVKTAERAPFGWPTIHDARCDEPKDRILVPGIRAGRWIASIDADGYEPTASRPVDVGLDGLAEPLLVELAPAREAIHGRVVSEEDGSSIADSVVRARESEWGTERETRTSTDGTFVFEKALGAPHPLTIHASAPGRFDGWKPFERGAPRPADGIIEIRLAAQASIAGRLRDAAGRPLAGRAVRATIAESEPKATRTRRTDSDGRFVFDGIFPGRYRLSAEGNGVAVEVIAGERAEVVLTSKP